MSTELRIRKPILNAVGLLGSLVVYLGHQIPRFQRFLPLGGVNRRFFKNCRSADHGGMSFRVTTCSTSVASLLATDTLDLRRILFKTFFGWLKKLTILLLLCVQRSGLLLLLLSTMVYMQPFWNGTSEQRMWIVDNSLERTTAKPDWHLLIAADEGL